MTLIPVLMYHAIGDGAGADLAGYVHTRSEFARHLDILRDAGYETITASTLARAVDGSSLPVSNPVLITFDDAYVDVVNAAVPELLQREMVASVYVPTDYIGATARWLHDPRDAQRRIMDSAQLRYLHSVGIECGAHSCSHPELDRIRHPQRLYAEVHDSKTRLEATLSAPVDTFAYPFGFHSMAARAAVGRAGFRLGLAVSDRPASIGHDDRRALPRLAVPPAGRAEDLLILMKRSRSPRHDSFAEAKRVAWRWKRRVVNRAPRWPALR